MIKPKRVIFLSPIQIDTLDERGIYQDLLRQFVLNGFELTVVCPVERRTGLSTRICNVDDATILYVRTLNIQKAQIFEKSLAILSINVLFKSAIKKYISNLFFDLVLYATPPITLVGTIEWLKKNSEARTYLLLKDIFPQNAVDMGLLKSNSLIYRYFKKKEMSLYKLSDYIGTMSPANTFYISERYPYLAHSIEENPNSIDLKKICSQIGNKVEILKSYGIPPTSVVFLYGGNLGQPQGASFLLSLINESISIENAFFLIVGDGTDYPALKDWFERHQPVNAKIIQRLSKIEYDKLASSCDVGIILLRREFTVPNFPSRILSYMENKMPILAMTDEVSDVGEICEKAGFGMWSLHGEIDKAVEHISLLVADKDLRESMGNSAFIYLEKSYDVEISYTKIARIFH